MNKLAFAFFVVALCGPFTYNWSAGVYWNRVCRGEHWDGARAAQQGVFYMGWQCYVRGPDKGNVEEWFEVDVSEVGQWEVEIRNLRGTK